MILPVYKQQEDDIHLTDSAGPSSAPPPPFRDEPSESEGLLIDFSEPDPILSGPGGEAPPPEFAHYNAENFKDSNGNIISHDPHLNSDGEALYRFLLSHSTLRPSFQLHCKGSHTETRYRQVTYRSEGRTKTRTESYTETMVDFDFYIDASLFYSDPVHWSVSDLEPAYRGGMVREIDAPEGKRKADRAEIKLFKGWIAERTALGLPPWVVSIDPSPEGVAPQANVLKSSKTLREWADHYCASPKYLKELVYEKVVYGWNVRRLESAVKATIAASPYSGDLVVEFQTSASKIYIRPDNRLSRMLSNKWLKFLSIILCIFPFIWLFKRFHSRGGGSWAVCGGAYALKSWVPAPPEEDPEDISLFKKGASRPAPEDGQVVTTSTGARLVMAGTQEGEFFRMWQPTIVRAVTNRYQSTTPLYRTADTDIARSFGLDG